MKKTIFKSTLLAIASVALITGSAFAIPVGTSLQNAFDARTEDGPSSIDVTTDMLNDQMDSAWTITASQASAATLLFEFASYANTNSFGIYDLGNKNNTLELFVGGDSAGPRNGGQTTLNMDTTLGSFDFAIDGDWSTFVTFSSANFGYYLDVAATGNIYYSNTDLNADSYDHMMAYQGNDVDQFSVFNNTTYATWTDNEYILAWEDLYNGGDEDFTDFVVMVESVEPVPEPATMLLFGTGLAGLAGFSRRKKNKKA